MLAYASRQDAVPAEAARQFASQHDPGIGIRDLDDAEERLERAGLATSPDADRLAATAHGRAWLAALHDARRERPIGSGPAYARAVRLYQGRPNPSSRPPKQAAFAWAHDDPRQLGLDFALTAPKPAEPPRDVEAERARMGSFASAQFRHAEATRPRRPREPRTPKPKRPWGRIELDAAGNLSTKGLRAWSERYALSLGDALASKGVPLPFPPGTMKARDRWYAWADRYQQASAEEERRRWAFFLKEWRRAVLIGPHLEIGQEGASLESMLRQDWVARAHYDDDNHNHAITSYLPQEDRPAYESLRVAVKAARIASWGGPEEERASARAVDLCWLDLLNRWLDAPWPARRNPEAGTANQRQRAATADRARLTAIRSEIRLLRADQRRARSERKGELDRAREQTQRIRGKVTAASAGRRERIRQRAHERIDRANARIAELRATKAWAKGKAPARGSVRRTLGEQNEAVESDIRAIDPMLVPLWRANRRLFKGTPHERYERFLEWADEQGESAVWEAVEKTLPTDRQLAADYEAWAREQGEVA